MNAWKQIEKEQLELGILVSTMPLCMSRRFPELMPRAYFEALYRQRRKQQNAAELLADRRSRAPRKRSPLRLFQVPICNRNGPIRRLASTVPPHLFDL